MAAGCLSSVCASAMAAGSCASCTLASHKALRFTDEQVLQFMFRPNNHLSLFEPTPNDTAAIQDVVNEEEKVNENEYYMDFDTPASSDTVSSPELVLQEEKENESGYDIYFGAPASSDTVSSPEVLLQEEKENGNESGYVIYFDLPAPSHAAATPAVANKEEKENENSCYYDMDSGIIFKSIDLEDEKSIEGNVLETQVEEKNCISSSDNMNIIISEPFTLAEDFSFNEDDSKGTKQKNDDKSHQTRPKRLAIKRNIGDNSSSVVNKFNYKTIKKKKKAKQVKQPINSTNVHMALKSSLVNPNCEIIPCSVVIDPIDMSQFDSKTVCKLSVENNTGNKSINNHNSSSTLQLHTTRASVVKFEKICTNNITGPVKLTHSAVPNEQLVASCMPTTQAQTTKDFTNSNELKLTKDSNSKLDKISNDISIGYTSNKKQNRSEIRCNLFKRKLPSKPITSNKQQNIQEQVQCNLNKRKSPSNKEPNTPEQVQHNLHKSNLPSEPTTVSTNKIESDIFKKVSRTDFITMNIKTITDLKNASFNSCNQENIPNCNSSTWNSTETELQKPLQVRIREPVSLTENVKPISTTTRTNANSGLLKNTDKITANSDSRELLEKPCKSESIQSKLSKQNLPSKLTTVSTNKKESHLFNAMALADIITMNLKKITDVKNLSLNSSNQVNVSNCNETVLNSTGTELQKVPGVRIREPVSLSENVKPISTTSQTNANSGLLKNTDKTTANSDSRELLEKPYKSEFVESKSPEKNLPSKLTTVSTNKKESHLFDEITRTDFITMNSQSVIDFINPSLNSSKQVNVSNCNETILNSTGTELLKVPENLIHEPVLLTENVEPISTMSRKYANLGSPKRTCKSESVQSKLPEKNVPSKLTTVLPNEKESNLFDEITSTDFITMNCQKVTDFINASLNSFNQVNVSNCNETILNSTGTELEKVPEVRTREPVSLSENVKPISTTTQTNANSGLLINTDKTTANSDSKELLESACNSESGVYLNNGSLIEKHSHTGVTTTLLLLLPIDGNQISGNLVSTTAVPPTIPQINTTNLAMPNLVLLNNSLTQTFSESPTGEQSVINNINLSVLPNQPNIMKTQSTNISYLAKTIPEKPKSNSGSLFKYILPKNESQIQVLDSEKALSELPEQALSPSPCVVISEKHSMSSMKSIVPPNQPVILPSTEAQATTSMQLVSSPNKSTCSATGEHKANCENTVVNLQQKRRDLSECLDDVPPFIKEVFKCKNIRDVFNYEDLIFVLSLLPDIEEMTQEQKWTFQVKLIELLKCVLDDPQFQ